MNPGALGDGVALDSEVLGLRLAHGENAGRVQPHGLLQAGLQVGHTRQIGRTHFPVASPQVVHLLHDRMEKSVRQNAAAVESCVRYCRPVHQVQIMIKSRSRCMNIEELRQRTSGLERLSKAGFGG
jgi:hypothetical protein